MEPLRLPFAHLNLRRNPFGELTAAERVEVAVADIEAHVSRLRRPGTAVQFLGAQGAGKSTYLLAITAQLPAARYVRLDRGDAIPKAPVLVLDELQWLPQSKRMQLFCRRCSFAIGSHKDLAGELADAGIDTQTVRLEEITLDRLRDMVNRRIEHVRRSSGPVPEIEDSTLEVLIRRHGVNVRAMELELYDAFQALKSVEVPVVLAR